MEKFLFGTVNALSLVLWILRDKVISMTCFAGINGVVLTETTGADDSI